MIYTEHHLWHQMLIALAGALVAEAERQRPDARWYEAADALIAHCRTERPNLTPAADSP